MVPLGLLARRAREPEIMDRPDLAGDAHREALRGLARLNAWSGSARNLWSALRARSRAARAEGRKALRVLDIATGSGDVPLGLLRLANKAGFELSVAGCDRSPTALASAEQNAREAGAQLELFELDALEGDLPQDYDVLTCSLFLHHLEEQQASALLRAMSRAARRAVIVQDLDRSLLGLGLAHLASRALTRSAVVQSDGPASVRGAFRLDEVRELAHGAGLAGFELVRCFPRRWLLSWSVGP